MAKIKKMYNPYSFPVRVLNDLGKEQIIPPNERAKVQVNDKKEYDQTPLTLYAYNVGRKGLQKRVKGLDLNLRRMTIPSLKKLAWALCINDELGGKTKRVLIQVVNDYLEIWIPSNADNLQHARLSSGR